MAGKGNERGVVREFVAESIGACAATPSEKKKAPLVFIAYAGGGAVSFAAMPYPVKRAYTAEDFLAAVAEAEGVERIAYADAKGRPRDIYLCRASAGTVTDIVPRDSAKNRFEDGFAEIAEADPRFSVKTGGESFKPGKKMTFSFDAMMPQQYPAGSYEHALVNAYNACLLGRVFGREELFLETRGGKRVRIEARSLDTAFVDPEVLFVKPSARDGFLDGYLTEEFNFIDGEDVSRRVYKISYSNRLGDYHLTRQ